MTALDEGETIAQKACWQALESQRRELAPSFPPPPRPRWRS